MPLMWTSSQTVCEYFCTTTASQLPYSAKSCFGQCDFVFPPPISPPTIRMSCFSTAFWFPRPGYPEIMDLFSKSTENLLILSEFGSNMSILAVAPCWQSISPWRAVSIPFRSCFVDMGEPCSPQLFKHTFCCRFRSWGEASIPGAHFFEGSFQACKWQP